MIRIGHGYDVHRFCDGDLIVIGGAKIPYEKKLLAHSDGDVLLHAIADALLGAAALGDIGYHFPDTDEAYKNIDSLILLKRVNLQCFAKVQFLVKFNFFKLNRCICFHVRCNQFVKSSH